MAWPTLNASPKFLVATGGKGRAQGRLRSFEARTFQEENSVGGEAGKLILILPQCSSPLWKLRVWICDACTTVVASFECAEGNNLMVHNTCHYELAIGALRAAELRGVFLKISR